MRYTFHGAKKVRPVGIFLRNSGKMPLLPEGSVSGCILLETKKGVLEPEGEPPGFF
jgi:hypothetical protein